MLKSSYVSVFMILQCNSKHLKLRIFRHKAYMSPEQSGRMSADPDSRTDIYSLGILFWTMLTQQPAFEGDSLMDIIRGVLGRRLPLISNIRLDVPDVIGKIVQKATAKTIGDRCMLPFAVPLANTDGAILVDHSASGLKHDLLEVRRFLSAGDSAALEHLQIGTKDVSSSFVLPKIMIGRIAEHDRIIEVIDRASKRHIISQRRDGYSASPGSSLSESRLASFDAASAPGDVSSDGDNTSRTLEKIESPKTTAPTPMEPKLHMADSIEMPSGGSSLHNSLESQDSLFLDFGSLVESVNGEGRGSKSNSEAIGNLTSQRTVRKFRKKGLCEIISIAGAAGLGKSCLIQSVQVEARRRGYFVSSKFDAAKKTPFGPVLELLSSLFKQVFSESDKMDPTFHQVLRQYVKPAWPLIHKVLGLPEFLLNSKVGPLMPSHSDQLSPGYSKSLRRDKRTHESSPTNSRSTIYNRTLGAQSSQDFLRAGSTTKSNRLMSTFLDVLRIFTRYKLICFCLDDIQYSDDESLDLITQLISARLEMVMIVTYRPDEMTSDRIKGIIDPPNNEVTGLHTNPPFVPSYAY